MIQINRRLITLISKVTIGWQPGGEHGGGHQSQVVRLQQLKQ